MSGEETLQQLRQAKEEIKARASGESGEETAADLLPRGGAAPAETDVKVKGADETEVTDPPAEEKEKIRIGDREFDNESDAFKYAEKLEQERLLAEAHTAGVREALEAQFRAQGGSPQAAKPEDDNFDVEFYKDPKKKIQEIKQQATQEAAAIIRAEVNREKLWNQFAEEYPDVRRKDAEMILHENAQTIGRMTDMKAAWKLLAAKVREEYAEIENLRKPKETLNSRKPTTTPTGGEERRVTPEGGEEKALSFAEQMRRLKK